jgi:hypothetical protein
MKLNQLAPLSMTLICLSSCQQIDNLRTTLGLSKKSLPTEVNREMEQVGEEEKKQSAGELAKANSELLSEIMKVIFNEKEVEDKNTFGSLVHSLNQGASLEGIYRGVIMGSRYRGMEAKSKAASPTTLKIFANEMAEIQVDMKNPTEFTIESRKALSIEFPDEASVSEMPTAAPRSQEVKEKREKIAIADDLVRMFIGASPFTLKRVLGEEALKKMDELKESQG